MIEKIKSKYNKQNDNLRFFSLNSNQPLAEKVAKALDVPIGNCEVKRFADGEVQIDIHDSVRNDIIFILQSTSKPVNENLMELLIFIDALRRASVKEINVVIPYYGYARQDRKARARQPITAKLVATMLENAGADRLIAVDLHAAQIQGFFDIPSDHLYGGPVISDYIRDHVLREGERIVVVSPDHGGVRRARHLAKTLDAPLAIIDKRRPKPNVAEVANIIGDVKGRTCIMIDDMIDTAGTLTKAAEKLKEEGATRVIASAIHGVLSEPAIERIANSEIEKVIITDTIYLPEEKRLEKIDVVSVDTLIAKAIKAVYEGRSLSELFEEFRV